VKGITAGRGLFSRAMDLRRFPARISSRPRVLLIVATSLLLLLGAARPAAAESLRYAWSLRGFMGRLAGIFLPHQGKGELRSRPNDGGRITELEITSPDSARGEYFLYGGETRPDGTTALAWSSYRWRGETKSKRDKVDDGDVVDVASGIHLIRERRPTQAMRMRIWSDGHVYPVLVERVGAEVRKVPAGTFNATHYRVRGVRTGERFWKGGLDLWLAEDEAATPVSIQVERGFANVRLELLPGEAEPRAASR
jgi:hypothetical protein